MNMYTKKELISVFMKIISETVEVFDHKADGKKGYISIALKLNAFAKMVSNKLLNYRDNFIDKNGVPYDVLMMSDTINEKVTFIEKEIIELSFEAIQILNNSAITDSDVDRLRIIEGRIILILKFDLPSVYSFEAKINGVSVADTMRDLYRIGREQGDFYTINGLWNVSTKKGIPVINMPETAIVMQGPIDYEEDFTLDTLLQYRRVYSDTPIILSTWENEVSSIYKWILRAVNIQIIENKKPDDPGFCNIKMQLYSTKQGIEACEKNESVKYVLKTRTDQRFFMPDFLLYMNNILDMLKPDSVNVSKRIIFLGGRNSSCIIPFLISDFISYGTIDDLINLYSASGDCEDLNSEFGKKEKLDLAYYDNLESVLTLDEADRQKINQMTNGSLVPESYLIKNYYERCIFKNTLNATDDTLLHYWKFLKECAIILDPNQLLLYWHKYIDKYYALNCITADCSLTSSVWLSIYHS